MKEIFLRGRDFHEVCDENNIYSIEYYDYSEEDEEFFIIRYEVSYEEYDSDYYIIKLKENEIVTIADYNKENDSIELEEYKVVFDTENEELCLMSLDLKNKYITDYDISDYYIQLK